MSCTAARRKRRAAEVAQRSATMTQQQAMENHLVTMKALYKEDPNKALAYCFEIIGEKQFQAALRHYLPKHLADVAFELSLRHCLFLNQEPKAPSTVH